jgi:hypothetical protein
LSFEIRHSAIWMPTKRNRLLPFRFFTENGD